SPAVDAVLVYGVIVAGVRFEFVVLFALSTGLQLLAAAQAMKLDGESIAWALVGLPMQLGYRQLLSLVTASALWAALAGLPGGCSRKNRPSRKRIGRSSVAANSRRICASLPIATGFPRPSILFTRTKGATAAASSPVASPSAARNPDRRSRRLMYYSVVADQ